MSPGVFRQVTPWLSARPERGRTKPAHPDGTAMAIPVGTRARPPAGSRCASAAAWRSYPASSGCCAVGRGRSPSRRRMRTCTTGRVRASVAQVPQQLQALLLCELDDGGVARMVDDDPNGTGREGVDLLGRESELQVVHRRRRLVARKALLVLWDAGDRRTIVQPERDRALDADQLGQPLVEPFLVVDLDEQRARELVRRRDELVVRLDLLLDLLVGEHALDACHLLDLKAHRVRVLERDRQEVAELDAATLLHRNDVPPELGALTFVLAQVLDVVERQLSHGDSVELQSFGGWHASGPGETPGPPDANGVSRGSAADLLEALREPASVALLGASQRLQPLADLLEPLVAGGAGEPGVHLGVLVGLALDRRLEVVGRRAHRDARHRVADLGEEVEVTEGVARLTLGDGTEKRRHVGVALGVRLLGEVEVAPVGLALAGERLLQVLVGLGAFQLGHGAPSCACRSFGGITRTAWRMRRTARGS